MTPRAEIEYDIIKPVVKINPKNMFNTDFNYFRKIDPDPTLFKVDIEREIYDHLKNDDMDEISKNEVVYKVLKEQLRQQQKRLIQMKEEKRLAKHQKMLKRRAKRSMSEANLIKFSKQIKQFQMIDMHSRDLSPELKRIVKNLTCQEHKFMYCPKCKDFRDEDFDPMENIQKFMKFVDHEKKKFLQGKCKKKSKSNRKLEEDSMSDITDLDK